MSMGQGGVRIGEDWWGSVRIGEDWSGWAKVPVRMGEDR